MGPQKHTVQVYRVRILQTITKTEAEWRLILTEDEYYITRLKGTEPPFSGKNFDACSTFLIPKESDLDSAHKDYAPVDHANFVYALSQMDTFIDRMGYRSHFLHHLIAKP